MGKGHKLLRAAKERKMSRAMITYLVDLYEWLVKKEQRGIGKVHELLRAAKERKLPRAIIAYVLKYRAVLISLASFLTVFGFT